MNDETKKQILLKIFRGRELVIDNDGTPVLIPEDITLDLYIIQKLRNTKILFENIIGDQVIVSDFQEDIDNGTLEYADITDPDETRLFTFNEMAVHDNIEAIDFYFIDADWLYLLKLSRRLTINNVLNDH